MASREIKVQIDIIGKPQFRRLVEFVRAVEDYARICADEDLMALVESARDDLPGMQS
jgi:hypothetical protein